MNRENHARSRRYLNWIGVIATVLGLTTTLGRFSGIRFLWNFGQAIAIAPAPIAFNEFSKGNGINVDLGPAFGCEDKAGNIQWGKWNYSLREQIPGPHRRMVLFIKYFVMMANAEKAPREEAQFVASTKYYFCNGGVLAQLSHCDSGIKAVHFRDVSPEGVAKMIHPPVLCAL